MGCSLCVDAGGVSREDELWVEVRGEFWVEVKGRKKVCPEKSRF